MGGSAGSDTTTTEPWQTQKPYLSSIYRNASDIYNNNATTPYEFSRIANQAGATTAGQDYAVGYAQNIAPKQFDKVNNTFTRNLNASNVGNNPYLKSAADAAINPIYTRLQQDVLPKIGSKAIQQGAYGGGRQGVLESSALKDTQTVAADTLAKFYGNAYQNGVQTESNTVNQAAGVNALGLQPGIIAGQVGQQRDAYNQSLVDANLNRYYEQFSLPWQDLAQYTADVQGNVGGTTTGPSSAPSRGQSAVSGAAAGTAVLPGWGTAIGAVGGYLLGG